MDDFSWFIGIFEGEGCISADKNRKNSPSLHLSMSDKDIMEKVSKLLETEYIEYQPKGEGVRGKYKLQYRINITGRKAEYIIKNMMPYLGERRQEKCREVLENYKPKVAYKTEGYIPKPKKQYYLPMFELL